MDDPYPPPYSTNPSSQTLAVTPQVPTQTQPFWTKPRLTGDIGRDPDLTLADNLRS